MHPLGQVQGGLLMGLDIAIRREHSDRYSETEQFGAITIENFVEGRPNSHKGAPDSVPATVCACYRVCLLLNTSARRYAVQGRSWSAHQI